MLLFLRFLLGAFFLLMGGAKLLAPYQNFLYIVQGYQIFPPFLEEFAARVVPWIELFLGVFLILGLWLKQALIALLILISGFLLILGQAILRSLPIGSCGCFGDWVSISMPRMVLIDSSLWLLTFLLLAQLPKALPFSLDNYFSTKD
jgi:hypothetical protein